MVIVTSLETRAEARDIYGPTERNGAGLSPNGKWVLLVEMDKKSYGCRADWCRLT